MRRLCATVLVMEAIVIGLAIPVAITIGHASPQAAGLDRLELGGYPYAERGYAAT